MGPTLEKKKITVKILEDIAGQIERFLLIQAATSILVAVATGLVLWSRRRRSGASHHDA